MQIEKGSNQEVNVNRFSFLLLNNKKTANYISDLKKKIHKAHISEAICIFDVKRHD